MKNYNSDRVNYDHWNEIKKRLQVLAKCKKFKEREVWWCAIGLNLGTEIFGKGSAFARPVLILKKFNDGQFLGVPLSTKDKTGQYYFNFSLRGQMSTAVLSQVRTFSVYRLFNRMGRINQETFLKLVQAYVSIFKIIRPLDCSRGTSA